jgi:hypothetical protein
MTAFSHLLDNTRMVMPELHQTFELLSITTWIEKP